MPATIIGIANPLILEPATWRRRWWRLHVTGTTAIGERSTDQAADDAGSQASGNDLSVIVVVVMTTVVTPAWRRRWWSAMIPTRRWAVAPLGHRGSGRSYGRAGEHGEGQCRKNDLLHECIPCAPGISDASRRNMHLSRLMDLE